jgi:hypothetical protein
MARAMYVDGKKLDKKYYENVMAMVDVDNITETIDVEFGIMVQNTDQRVIPTDDIIVRGENGSTSFDRNQMSSLELGTPVVILLERESWLYVRSSHTEGWVHTNTVARCTRAQAARWENPTKSGVKFAMVVRYKAPVYLDESLTDYYGWLPLGDKLLVNSNGNLVLPTRAPNGKLFEREVYVEPKYINMGYLPYTSRTMLNISFEMLNAPYGWGGMFGEQDCSSFLIKLFSTVGIVLPRNSAQQGNSGKMVYTQSTTAMPSREMLDFFGIPGATLVQMPGHVMLYIGSERGHAYVIHAMWAFVEQEKDKLVARTPARVIVSNLGLSAVSDSGAYYDRVSNIRNVDVPRFTGGIDGIGGAKLTKK